MEIALNSILILLILIFPGALFRRCYYRGEFSKQYDSQSWYHTLFISSIWGSFVHLVILISYFYLPGNIPESFITQTLICLVEEGINGLPVSSYGTMEIFYFMQYAGSIFLFSFFLALFLFWLIRATRLDLHSNIFRFNNYWHYYFKGEILQTSDFASNPNRKKKVLDTLADILVQTGDDKTILYNGYIKQYSLSKKNGQLDNIYLTNTIRYKEGRDENGNTITRDVPGDIMVIPYHRVLNLNLNFVFDVKSEEKDNDPVFNLFLIILYSIIWIDILNWFEGLIFWKIIFLKSAIHVASWSYFSFLYASTFRIKKYTIEDKRTIQFITEFFGLILLIIFCTVFWFDIKDILFSFFN